MTQLLFLCSLISPQYTGPAVAFPQPKLFMFAAWILSVHGWLGAPPYFSVNSEPLLLHPDVGVEPICYCYIALHNAVVSTSAAMSPCRLLMPLSL